jgi:hypothetical protein
MDHVHHDPNHFSGNGDDCDIGQFMIINHDHPYLVTPRSPVPGNPSEVVEVVCVRIFILQVFQRAAMKK